MGAAVGYGTCAQLSQTIILMKPKPNFGWKAGQVLWTFILIFTCALSLSARNDLQAPNTNLGGGRPQSVNISTADIPERSAPNSRLEVTRYVMDYDGDHSLDVATVVEQDISGFARYSVELRLASGVEQSFVVAAPPGGLRVEMRDMTGDKVPNDLLLQPALLHRPPTVLVNDGHDHFTVAISAGDPGSFSSGQELAPGGNDGHGTIGLMSSRFRTGGLKHSDQLFPQLREITFSFVSQLCVRDSEHPSSSGRSPPFPATLI
jgi:hypothetical protein